MSTFSVIMLAIVAYFCIGGAIMGLIDGSFEFMECVQFWPVHVIAWFVELAADLGDGVREFSSIRRKAVND